MSSLSVRFFNSFKSKYLNFFFFLFDCQVSCVEFPRLVGLDGLEPSTSRLSGVRSSHLSYRPVFYSLALWFVPLRRSAGFRTVNSTSSSCWTSRDLRLRYFSNPRRKPLLRKMVEMKGFEPLTPCLQGRCSPNWATPPYSGLYLRTLNWILTIEQQNLSVQRVIHIYQVFVLIWLRSLKNVSRS